jgi:hypothetical protein
MTEQEVFNTAWNALSARGWTRAGIEIKDSVNDEYPYFQCRYRSPVGPCALGAVIPDDEYVPEWDTDRSTTTERICDIVSTLRGLDKGFLTGLQSCHDKGRTPLVMEEDFRAFAAKYGLTIPA